MTHRWKPNVTVAAVIEREGRFLLVEERTSQGLLLNNPAGHLDPGETLVQACVRETREETAFAFEPQALVGVYLSAPAHPVRADEPVQDKDSITYLRFVFRGVLGAHDPRQRLDHGIVRTLWMSPHELRASTGRHRSPAVLRSVEDYLAGASHPLQLLHADFGPGADWVLRGAA